MGILILIHFLLDFLLQSSHEEFEQQIFLSLVRGIVVQGKDDSVHKLCGFVLGHLEYQLGQIGWIGLKQRMEREHVIVSPQLDLDIL